MAYLFSPTARRVWSRAEHWKPDYRPRLPVRCCITHTHDSDNSSHKQVKSSKKLINDPRNIISEYLAGYSSSVPHLQLLEGSPEVNIATTPGLTPGLVLIEGLHCDFAVAMIAPPVVYAGQCSDA